MPPSFTSQLNVILAAVMPPVDLGLRPEHSWNLFVTYPVSPYHRCHHQPLMATSSSEDNEAMHAATGLASQTLMMTDRDGGSGCRRHVLQVGLVADDVALQCSK